MFAIPPELGRRYDMLLERKDVAVEQRLTLAPDTHEYRHHLHE